MRLRWSPRASHDLAGIADYIALENEPASQRVVSTIIEMLETLTMFPNKGRPGRTSNTREQVLAPLPYIAVYRVADDSIEVVRILHSAQRWPQHR